MFPPGPLLFSALFQTELFLIRRWDENGALITVGHHSGPCSANLPDMAALGDIDLDIAGFPRLAIPGGQAGGALNYALVWLIRWNARAQNHMATGDIAGM